VRPSVVRRRRIEQAAAARGKRKEGPQVGPVWRQLGREGGAQPTGRFGPDGPKRLS
jgi:hypothetical protein